MTNPLRDQSLLPAFSQIRPEHVVPALEEILAENTAQIQSLLDNQTEYSWENLMVPWEQIKDRLNHLWSPVSHLNSVMSQDSLRAAYKDCLPKLSTYHTQQGQNTELYQAVLSLTQRADYAHLSAEQKKVIEHTLRDFELSGVALNNEQKHRYQMMTQQLSELCNRFSDNVLDATQAWFFHTEAADTLSGLPSHALTMAAEAAKQRHLPGWVLTLDHPCYVAVMSYADNRTLRQNVYKAYITRASDQSDDVYQWDNSRIMEDILRLRHDLAQLLGFEHYAAYSLATKMAQSSEQVVNFLKQLADAALPFAQQEMQTLIEFAQKTDGLSTLAPWDIAYYSEKLRQQCYDLSQEDLRPYFPIDRVLSGMFTVIEKLYGMHVTEISGVDTWHEHVRFFGIVDSQGHLRGQFYLDLYARNGKRGGAWMDECQVRRRLPNGKIQTPVAYLVCNFSPPAGDKQALLTHDEVITLFHEFGHGLHHMLTKVEYADISGINGVPWDAVELPSQFMENWCWEKPALDLIASHHETGASLPADLLKKMLAAKNFQAGMQILRQIEFSLFDWRLHTEYKTETGIDIQAILDDVRAHYSLLPAVPYNRFQHSFSHIFAGGYAAGYYSYKWAEVLASDAFSRFEQEGIFNQEAGKAFLEHILERGGSEDAMTLFKAFRGHEPQVEPLLRHNGLLAVA